MKKTFLLALSCWLVTTAFAQHESVGPITRQFFGKASAAPTRASNPIDSTFVYNLDTLTLPFFDEFSKSRFQKYDAQPTDPNVTEQLFHQLLDVSDVPLPADDKYSLVQTYRYETQAGLTDTIDLPGISIKIGDFSEYPVVYATTTVYPPHDIYDTLDFVNDIDTIWKVAPDIVVQDSALIFTVQVSDPNALWADHYAYHNYTFAVNPWTLGVATFDGLDENGMPYNFGSSASGIADFLTSKPLDLSGLQPSDSIYLSFLVQPEGFGDVPESVDSLKLEFYDVNADQWNQVWSMGGSSTTDFKVGHIRLTQAIYFTDGFRFRFKNRGGLSGSLDHFHLDYVHLRTLSGIQDTLFKDFAFVYPVGSLIEDYTQVPWDHWKNSAVNHMNDSVVVTVRNGSNQLENNLDGNVAVEYAGAAEGSFLLIDQLLSAGNNYAARTTVESYHDCSGGYQFDPATPGDAVTFDIIGAASAQFPNFVQNDSCFTTQQFADVYAYDDGSAEKAYGPTGVQARLAYQFTPYEADSLIGVKMHFVPSVNDVSDKLFLLSVWNDNNGQPGSVIYEDEFFFPRTPQYEDSIGKFTTYYLKDTMKLAITGTFYVGWRQIDADRLNIGLDMNNDNSDKIFYSINGGGTWSNTSFAGSMMMRPIFSTALNADLAVEERELVPSWELYPNPTSGVVSIDWNESTPFPGAVCVDAQGRVIGTMDADNQTIDLGFNPAGIYFVQLNGYSHLVKKVIRY
ncbi:MAG TPA: T9SS type A sorting domain-containing protein [Fluviicola sp.]|nr:T9SS type A sorting domain-containing protein [Fluviicola sp.]